MLKSQPMLLLKAISGSVAMHQQGSVWMSIAHITTRDDGDVCDWSRQLPGTTWMSRDCTELGPQVTVYGILERRPHLSPDSALGRACSVPHPSNRVELVLVGGGTGEPALRA